MNLYGFRIHTPWRNVEVWEWRQTRLEFLAVLTHRIVSVVPERGNSGPPFRHMSSFLERFRPLAFRVGSGPVTHVPTGFIVTTSLSDTLEFLANTAVPCGDGLIDRYLREASAGTLPPTQLRHRLGTLLWHGGRCRGYSYEDHPRRRLDLQVLSDAPIVWHAGHPTIPYSELTAVEGLDGSHFYPVETWRYFLCPVDVPFAGGLLARAAWLCVNPQGQLRGFWDGSCTHGPTGWDDLSRPLRRQVARHGTVLPLHEDGERPFDLTNAPIEARFLLCVPPAACNAEEPARRPRHRVLHDAALLVDPRWPVRLQASSKRLPVIEDPSTVRWVLHRTTPEGVFVPEMPPLPTPIVFAPGRTIVGALPGRSASPRVRS